MAHGEAKFEDLLKAIEMDQEEFIYVFISMEEVPGICVNSHCDEVADVGPEELGAECPRCGTMSVTSGLVLCGALEQEEED